MSTLPVGAAAPTTGVAISTSTPPPELSRPVSLGQLGGPALSIEVHAQPAECLKVAERLRIIAVETLDAGYTLCRVAAGIVRADGHLRARVVQECVVTLEPFESIVEERFTVRFVPATHLPDTDDEILDPEEIDEIPYEGDWIDLGEAAVEQLALALDPFPRRPGLELPDPPDGTRDGPEADANPFALLRARKS